MRNFLWSRFRYEFRYYNECAIRTKILKFARFVEPEPSFNSKRLSRFSLSYFQPFFWFYPVQHCLSYGLSNHFVHEVACWPKANETNIEKYFGKVNDRILMWDFYIDNWPLLTLFTTRLLIFLTFKLLTIERSLIQKISYPKDNFYVQKINCQKD